MTTRVETWGGTRVAICADEGPLLATAADVGDFLSEAWGHEADWLVVPTARLSPDFFGLRTGLAGEATQKFATYRTGLAVVGDISAAVAASDALRDYVRESNRGRQIRFAPDLETLKATFETGRFQ